MTIAKAAYWFAFFILCINTIYAQSKTKLRFSFVYDATALILSDTVTELDTATHLQVSDLKFYISKIRLLKNKKVVWEEKNGVAHLMDASKITAQTIELQKAIDADELVFSLGIDSSTNVSGALGGDLDPSKGMYWTWQSGYINFKLEGKSKLCKTRNNEFQFHLGGYTQPYYCLETITLPIFNSTTLTIQLDVKKLIEQLDLSKQAQIMSPSKDAIVLSKKIVSCFNLIKP